MTVHSISGANPHVNLTTDLNRQVNTTQNDKQGNFGKAILDSLNKINQQQEDANTSIVDLMSGKQEDVNSVVASVAKADMSFKLLVGVRNKLVEAYKETMRMQI